MKNLLTNEEIDMLVSRVSTLNKSLKPAWGNLTVAGMLYHCNIVTHLIITSDKSRKPTFKERLLKPVFYILKKLPKNFKSSNQLISSNPENLNFEEERDKFIEKLLLLKNNTALKGVHPFFGPFNTNQWRKFLLLHTKHHLKQFNV